MQVSLGPSPWRPSAHLAVAELLVLLLLDGGHGRRGGSGRRGGGGGHGGGGGLREIS